MRRYDAAVAGIVAGLALVLAGCGEETGEPGATVTVTEQVTVTPSESLPDGPSSDGPSAEPSESPSGEPSSDPADIPRTYDAAMEHFDTWGGEPVEVGRFQSPSRNIYCVVQHDPYPAGCEIREGAVRDRAVCEGGFSELVGRIEFQLGRATPVCNTDTFWEPGAQVLGYGEAARMPGGDVMCLSETIGVTCVSLTRTEGFFLHKGEYVIFNAG